MDDKGKDSRMVRVYTCTGGRSHFEKPSGSFRAIKAPSCIEIIQSILALLVDFFVHSLGGLGLLGSEEAANPAEGLIAHHQSSGDSRFALGDETLLLNLLDLARVNLENVILALKTLVVREEDQRLGVIVELGGRLLDNGESLVNLVEGLVAKGIGMRNIWRDVLVRTGKPRKNRSGESLVG